MSDYGPRSGPPPVVAIDADGYWWRVYEGEFWSMVPTNPDNTPIPVPVTLYRLVLITEVETRAASEPT